MQSQQGPAKSAWSVARGLWKYVWFLGWVGSGNKDPPMLTSLFNPTPTPTHSHRSGGVPAFYRGLTPALVRAFPTSATTFCAYEWTLRFLDGL